MGKLDQIGLPPCDFLGPRSLDDFSFQHAVRGLQLFSHIVESSGQAACFIGAGNGDAVSQVASGNPLGALLQYT
jgi:hypothetical protein